MHKDIGRLENRIREQSESQLWYPLVIGVYSAKSPSAVNATFSGYSVFSPRGDKTLTFH